MKCSFPIASRGLPFLSKQQSNWEILRIQWHHLPSRRNVCGRGAFPKQASKPVCPVQLLSKYRNLSEPCSVYASFCLSSRRDTEMYATCSTQQRLGIGNWCWNSQKHSEPARGTWGMPGYLLLKHSGQSLPCQASALSKLTAGRQQVKYCYLAYENISPQPDWKIEH